MSDGLLEEFEEIIIKIKSIIVNQHIENKELKAKIKLMKKFIADIKHN